MNVQNNLQSQFTQSIIPNNQDPLQRQYQQNQQMIKNMAQDLDQLFSKNTNQNTIKQKLMINNNQQTNQQTNQQNDDCQCKQNVKCPDCNTDYQNQEKVNQDCQCYRIKCQVCSQLATNMKYLHENAAQAAQQFATQEESLAKQSELQAKLFILAQKYAKEQYDEEEKAKRTSIQLQESTSKAQISRNKMLRAIQQAKGLALKSYQFNRWDVLLKNMQKDQSQPLNS